MQLSPRQYQVDPTGSAYVQDTRPLMAAMGAQAASQIESNRMMTETMQRGMQGIEDFAARRQLAAARAQLGALNIEDESYGQKLSELVMDNPLAFTNRKTAAVANMAFKQAGEDFRNKRDNEMRMAMQAQEFSNSRTLASMSQANQLEMARRNRAADIKSMVFQEEAKVSNKTIDRLDELLTQDLLPEERAAVEKQRGLEVQKVNNLGNQFEQEVFVGDMAPLPQYVPAEGQTFGAGKAANLGGASLFPDTSVPPTPMDAVPESGAPFTESGIQIPAAGAPQVAAPLASQIEMEASMAPAAEAPVIPAAASTPATPVSTGLTPQEQALVASAASRVTRTKKKDDTMSAAEFQDQQNFTEDLITADPEVGQLMSDVSALTNESKALETLISSNKLVPNADQQAQFLASQRNLTDKTNQLNKLRAAKRLEIRNAGGAAQYQIKKAKQEQERLDAAVKAQNDPATAAANARLASAFAGTPSAPPAGADIPPPPLNDMAKGFAKIETPRKIAEANIVPDTNNQWTNAKNQVVDAVGGMDQLIQIADEVFQNNIFGISLPADRARLINAIANKIPGGATKAIKGFEQKSERLGMESISAQEIIASLVDDVIRARGEGVAAAKTAAAAPTPKQAPDMQSGVLKPPRS